MAAAREPKVRVGRARAAHHDKDTIITFRLYARTSSFRPTSTTNLSLCRYSLRFTTTHTHDSNHVSTPRHIVHLDDHVPIRRWRCPSSSMQPMSTSCLPHITACSPLLLATNPTDCYCLPPLHTGPHAFAAQRWCTRDFYCWPSSAPIYLITPVKAVSRSRSTHQYSRARSTKVFACKYVISGNHICYHKAPKKEQAASS